MSGMSRDRARRIAGRVEAWFAGHARAFPWRPEGDGARDGYVSLVSEIMLQQTQAARVAERLPEFLKQFPTATALAGADEDAVLRAWEGLGYYRRARSLHAAARVVAAEYGGVVPRDVERLRGLPGVGAYTAGAVASIAYGVRAACVDGNIQRVLMRVEGIDLEQDAPETRERVWDAAERLVDVCVGAGALNEGLMELGATVCLAAPRGPECGRCPLNRLCIAKREGREREIPRAKKRREPTAMHHETVVIAGRSGLRVQQRGDSGLWRRMWEPITLEGAAARSGAEVRSWAGVKRVEEAGSFEHRTTHRIVRVRVWRGVGAGRGTPGEWAGLGRARDLAMSNAARRALEVAGFFG